MARGRLSGSQLKKKHPRVVRLRKRKATTAPKGLRTAAGRGKILAPPAVVESRKERKGKGKKHPGRSKPINIRKRKGAVGPKTRALAGEKFTKRKFQPKPEMPSDLELITYARRSQMPINTSSYGAQVADDAERRRIVKAMHEGAGGAARPPRKSFDSLSEEQRALLLKKHVMWAKYMPLEELLSEMRTGFAGVELNGLRRRWEAGEEL